MKKRFMASVFAVLIALSCTACSADSDKESNDSQSFTPKLDTEEEATVNIIGCMGNFESLEAVITDFEKYYPNCEVLYSTLTEGSEYKNVLAARLGSDESVGIFMMSDDMYEYTTDAVRETCANLFEEDIDLSAIQDEVISSSTTDGKLFYIPLMHNASGLIANETLLEEQGLEIPTNYSEFLSVCDALKGAGYVPLQGRSNYLEHYLVRAMSFVLMNNEFESESDANLASLEAGEEGSAAVLQPVFDVLSTMYEKQYTTIEMNATYEDNYNDSILRFFEGDVPFLVGTTETFSGMAKRESKSENFSENPFEYVFMTVPLAEDGSYSYIENWYGFSVNENCPDKKWSVEFMRFLTTNEEINKIAYVKGLPSVAKETDDDRFIGLYSSNEEYECTIDSVFPLVVQDALNLVETELVNRAITLDDATSEMERRIRENDLEDDS